MKYAQSDKGLVHVIHPIQGEFTLCGDSFDLETTDGVRGANWKERSRGPVTCAECALVVQQCRGIRISKNLCSNY